MLLKSKYVFSIAVAALTTLSGCSMGYEEFESRKNWCERRGMKWATFESFMKVNGVAAVYCITDDGYKFDSEYEVDK